MGYQRRVHGECSRTSSGHHHHEVPASRCRARLRARRGQPRLHLRHRLPPSVRPRRAPRLHHHALAPVVYTAAAGCQNDAGAVVPCAHGGLVGVVPAAPVAAAEPAVEEARKKREATAEAEADPEAEAEAWLFYRTHGYWPVGYGHLAYSYAPYAYAHHYGYYYGYYGRKKREATAEAEA